MNKYSNPVALMKKFLVLILVALMAAGLFPVDAYGSSVSEVLSGGSAKSGLTVKWYTAARYVGTMSLFGTVDYASSMAAYNSFDRSKCIGTEKISNLSDIDMSKVADFSEYASTERWIWGEVSGYVRIPEGVQNGKTYNWLYSSPTDMGLSCIMEVDGVTVEDKWKGPGGATGAFVMDALIKNSDGSLKGINYAYFHLCIGNPNGNVLKEGATVNFIYSTYEILSDDKAAFNEILISDDDYYSSLAFQDMKPFFIFDPDDFTITLSSFHSWFPVSDYEYGICKEEEVWNAANFKPLAFGTNQLDRSSGSIIIRNKYIKLNYVVLDTVSTVSVNDLAVTKRTPTTATLSWSPPASGQTPTSYDIYRKSVSAIPEFSFNSAVSYDMEPKLIGSTPGLTYTDQGAAYDGIYEYYVKARYNTGASNMSEAVRSDSVPMEGIASTPTNLKVKDQSQNTATLSWNESESVTGVKEYIIYRNLTHHQTDQTPSTSSTGGIVIIGDITLSGATERGRSGSASFTDTGLVMGDEVKYYVQAVDYNGIPSFISSPVAISVPDLTKPTKPANLQVGDVLRYGNKVEYDFPEDTVARNVVLGSEQEVALQWEPSVDNVGVAGYNVYRSASGQDPSSGMFWSDGRILITTTKDTFVTDKGLKYGLEYLYSVEAIDVNGLKSDMNQVVIGTEKSGLASLKISNGSGGYLYPDPLFKYYQTDYKLDVDNSVKNISLIPGKLDSKATVKINGTEVKDSASGGPYALDPGENTFTIEVVPRPASTFNVSPETTIYTLTVNRANITSLPALTLPEILAVVKEGDPFKASGKLDVKDGLPWTGTAEYGDGTGKQALKLNADGSFDLEHSYADNGTYQVKVDFWYKDLGLVAGTLKAVVENVAPSLTGGGINAEYTLTEGSTLSFGGIITDPGHDNWTVIGRYGGKSVAAEVDQENKTFSFKETFYDQQPVYDMILEIMDDDGGLFTRHIKVNVENVLPVIEVGDPMVVQKGVEFTRIVSFTDPGQDNWSATVNCGLRAYLTQPVTVNKDRTFELKNTYQYTGNYNIYISLSDGGGKTTEVTLPVKVKDLVVAVDAGKDISVSEGQSFEKSIQLSGSADLFKKIIVDYGDGTKEQELSFPKQIIEIAQYYTINASLKHSYADNGTYTVTVKATDRDGDVCKDSFKAEVSNVSPEVSLTRMKGDRVTGATLSGTGRITDPGADSWTGEIDYGDGTKENIKADSDGTFSYSHSYGNPGLYVVTASVQDDDGGAGGDSQKVVINRPKTDSSEISSDATLHSLLMTDSSYLRQNAAGYTGIGFTPECLIYRFIGGTYTPNLTVTADSGATITYSNGSVTDQIIQSGVTVPSVDISSDLLIIVTAEDGVTEKTYKVSLD